MFAQYSPICDVDKEVYSSYLRVVDGANLLEYSRILALGDGHSVVRDNRGGFPGLLVHEGQAAEEIGRLLDGRVDFGVVAGSDSTSLHCRGSVAGIAPGSRCSGFTGVKDGRWVGENSVWSGRVGSSVGSFFPGGDVVASTSSDMVSPSCGLCGNVSCRICGVDARRPVDGATCGVDSVKQCGIVCPGGNSSVGVTDSCSGVVPEGVTVKREKKKKKKKQKERLSGCDNLVSVAGVNPVRVGIFSECSDEVKKNLRDSRALMYIKRNELSALQADEKLVRIKSGSVTGFEGARRISVEDKLARISKARLGDSSGSEKSGVVDTGVGVTSVSSGGSSLKAKSDFGSSGGTVSPDSSVSAVELLQLRRDLEKKDLVLRANRAHIGMLNERVAYFQCEVKSLKEGEKFDFSD